MTRTQLISALNEAGSTEAKNEASVILEEIFGISRASQLCEPLRDYDDAILHDIIKRRKEREPLQYILGYAYFCTEKYKLSKNTLIPRQDTELVVETAAHLCPTGAHVIDLCTGSGCIAISLCVKRKDITAKAVDISKECIEITNENAQTANVADRVEGICSDLFSHPCKDELFDAVISNPPYIQKSVIDTLDDEVLKEPRIALDGGEDGMDFYRYILKNYKDNLKAKGYFIFEIGYDQKDDIEKEAEKFDLLCEVICDCQKNPRVAVIKKHQRI